MPPENARTGTIRYDTELVRDLSRVRSNFDDMRSYYACTIKDYDEPGKREGREELLESMSKGEDYCAHIVATIDKIVAALESFRG